MRNQYELPLPPVPENGDLPFAKTPTPAPVRPRPEVPRRQPIPKDGK